jgi:hypothetical protein
MTFIGRRREVSTEEAVAQHSCASECFRDAQVESATSVAAAAAILRAVQELAVRYVDGGGGGVIGKTHTTALEARNAFRETAPGC